MPTVGGIGKVSSEELPKIMSKSGARNHTVFSKACHVVCSTQCGNLKNFLPLRFYVKPILCGFITHSKSAKMTILKALNCEFGDFCQFSLLKFYQNSKFKVTKTVKNDRIWNSKLSQISFTEVLHFRRLKTGILPILEALNFDFCESSIFESVENSQNF